MRRNLALLMVSVLAGCASTKTIDGVEYDTYGLLNEESKRNPDVQYEVCWGNVFWGALLIETVVAPVYFFGFSLHEPVGRKPAIKGQVAR